MDDFKLNKILENQKVLNYKLDGIIGMLLEQQDFNNIQSFISGLTLSDIIFIDEQEKQR